MITPEQEKKYLENKGLRCPFCDSKDIECGPSEDGDDGINQKMSCHNPDCGEEWTDYYKLAGASQD